MGPLQRVGVHNLLDGVLNPLDLVRHRSGNSSRDATLRDVRKHCAGDQSRDDGGVDLSLGAGLVDRHGVVTKRKRGATRLCRSHPLVELVSPSGQGYVAKAAGAQAPSL